MISFDFKPTCAILVKHAAAIGIFVSEAITNALKYSHPTELMLKICISMGSNTTVVIEIADNGPGLPTGLDPTLLAARAYG